MPVVIVGSGRCGSSMITRMLALCGLNIGSRADMTNQPDCYNPTGYWENRAFYSIDEKILRHYGGNELVPPVLPTNWQFDESLEPIVSEAILAVQKLSSNSKDWGWKDPRSSLTLPFWQRIIPNLKVVICVRNPLDVAFSYKHYAAGYGDIADCLGANQGLINWRTYTASAIETTTIHDRIFTYYEDYFPDYHEPLSRLLKFCGLPEVERESALDRQLQSFHDPSLKHYKSTLLDLIEKPDVPGEVKVLYQRLLDWREDPCVEEPPLRALAKEYALLPRIDLASYDSDKICKIVHGYIGLESRRLRLEGTLALRSHRFATKISSALEWRRRHVTQLKAFVADRYNRFVALFDKEQRLPPLRW